MKITASAVPILALTLLVSIGPLAAQEQIERPLDDVTVLPAFTVKGDRMEDLGLRLFCFVGIPPTNNRMWVAEVFPNTAASKAGLRPGEWIDKIDGKSVGMKTIMSLGFKPEKLQQRMWDQLARGKQTVSVTMEVRAPKSEKKRTVALTLPSPAPRWGSEKWSTPEGRTSAMVSEPGPLAAIAREVLDNGIWSGSYERPGYEWRIVQRAGGHRIWVTQQNGRTEIKLEHQSAEGGRGEFITSPSGALESGHWTPLKKRKGTEIGSDELRARFGAEIDFWIHKVGRVTGRWPFEALIGETAVISSVANRQKSRLTTNGAKRADGASDNGATPLSKAFLNLRAATPEQKMLFGDAIGKIGLDAEGWAYTETSRPPDGSAVTTVRYDPSKPPAERSTLLKVDGRNPKPAYLKQWLSEDHAPLPGWGELPPLSTVVDLNDVRILAEETSAVVFESPVRAVNGVFPPDKFQACFRVNRTSRAFEDFSVRLREPMRVAGVAKVVEAGIEARFQTFDPALAPQPVLLKIGGGVRMLLAKVSRSLEITRTDFKRVVPLEGAEAATVK